MFRLEDEDEAVVRCAVGRGVPTNSVLVPFLIFI